MAPNDIFSSEAVRETQPDCEHRPHQRSSVTATLVDGVSSRVDSVSVTAAGSGHDHASLGEEWGGIRWRGVLAICAGIFQQTLCWGMIMTFGCILSFYTRHLMPEVSKRALCLVGVLPPFFLLALALLWGRLLDAGHHRKLNIFAGICLTGGMTGFAFTAGNGNYGEGHYWAILLASVPIGLGQSVYFLAAPHMAKTWYPDHKGLAMGITNSGAAVGGIAWPFVFTELTARGGFRAGIGGLAGITAVLACFIVWASVAAPSFQHRPVAQKSVLSTWIPFKAFRSKTLLIHIAAMCCIYLGILTIPFFTEYWAQKHHLGISEDTVANPGVNPGRMAHGGNLTVYLVVIMNACQLPGRCLGSTLCDYVRARKIHCIACVVAIALVLPFWLASKTYAQAANFAGLYGLTLGIMVSLPINDAQEILGAHRTHLLGQYAGVVYTCASPFILAGAVISGELVDTYHISAAGIWAASAFTAGAVLIAISRTVKDDTWKFDEPGQPSLRQHAMSEDEETQVGHDFVLEQEPVRENETRLPMAIEEKGRENAEPFPHKGG